MRIAILGGASLPLVLLLASCGGGGADPLASAPAVMVAAAETGGRATIQSVSVNVPQSIAAATSTANSTTNACSTAQPFYWELGTSSGALVSGSVGASGPTSQTTMAIASASKWVYAAYVAQLRGGNPTASDIKYLTMKSGYVSFQTCLKLQTVASCLAYQTNGVYSPQFDGIFDYNSGHMQAHANLIGLGPNRVNPLAAAMKAQLGSDLALSYGQPQLAGGLYITPATYTQFLRKVLAGSLSIGSLLGSNAVCTNPTSCPTAAPTVPVPLTLYWHYSLGHWVEDDPTYGDGAFSSLGTNGFYPWIDATKSYYGVVARSVANGGDNSATCGQLIRTAWTTGTAQ